MEKVPEPEDSSPVLTWIFVFFWSFPRGVSPRLEWGHARALSSRAVPHDMTTTKSAYIAGLIMIVFMTLVMALVLIPLGLKFM